MTKQLVDAWKAGPEGLEVKRLRAENAKLRVLVRGLIYATHPADRARLIADAAELGVEEDE